jgi:hypothetical protein
MERCPSHILSWSVPHFSHCWMPSPLQAHRGRCCHTHLLLLAIYSSHERVFLPLSLVDFSTWQPVTSLPHSKVAGLGLPLLSSFAGLFIYSLREGVLLPHSLELRAPHPLCFVSFFFSAAHLLFILSRALCWFVPGSTACHLLAHLCDLPNRLAVWEPSWFLCLTWCGDTMCRLGVWRSQSFASSW